MTRRIADCPDRLTACRRPLAHPSTSASKRAPTSSLRPKTDAPAPERPWLPFLYANYIPSPVWLAYSPAGFGKPLEEEHSSLLGWGCPYFPSELVRHLQLGQSGFFPLVVSCMFSLLVSGACGTWCDRQIRALLQWWCLLEALSRDAALLPLLLLGLLWIRAFVVCVLLRDGQTENVDRVFWKLAVCPCLERKFCNQLGLCELLWVISCCVLTHSRPLRVYETCMWPCTCMVDDR